MKKLYLIFFLLLSYEVTFGQCNCQKMIKEGGTIVTCPPNVVSYDNTTAIGLSVGKSKNDVFITVTIGFKESAKKVDSKLTLWIMDGNSINIELFNGGLAYIKDSQVAHGVYKLNESQINKLKKSNIRTVAFSLTDGLRRTYTAKSNADIIANYLNYLI